MKLDEDGKKRLAEMTAMTSKVHSPACEWRGVYLLNRPDGDCNCAFDHSVGCIWCGYCPRCTCDKTETPPADQGLKIPIPAGSEEIVGVYNKLRQLSDLSMQSMYAKGQKEEDRLINEIADIIEEIVDAFKTKNLKIAELKSEDHPSPASLKIVDEMKAKYLNQATFLRRIQRLPHSLGCTTRFGDPSYICHVEIAEQALAKHTKE